MYLLTILENLSFTIEEIEPPIHVEKKGSELFNELESEIQVENCIAIMQYGNDDKLHAVLENEKNFILNNDMEPVISITKIE